MIKDGPRLAGVTEGGQIRVTRKLIAATVAWLAVALVFVSTPAHAQADLESDFVARVNSERSSRGLGTLRVDGELTGIARRWSGNMASSNTLSHNPNLSREVTADWEKLAENVGVGSDVGGLHQAFMNSSAHRANILDPVLTHIGVGVVVGGDNRIWVTQVFMRLRGGGGGTSPPPTTSPPQTTTSPPPPPPTTARPAPVTTARPAPRPTTTAARTATTRQPPPPPPPPPEPEPQPEPEPAAPAAPPPVPPRLALVLEGLRQLDAG